MTDHAHPDRPELRLSDAERDAAVAALAEAHSAGRLTAAEYSERVIATRAAVTRGDLVPLFADLPAAETPAAAYDASSLTPPAAAGTGYEGYAAPRRRGDGTGGALGGAAGATIMALVPFVALILFLVSGFSGGWAWAWAWFLLVPIAGIIIYGPGSDERRRRGR
ncbi:DUF1707 SHOCT-like domain-containing protein [Agromyces sp. Marseille-Q5079]|uniref:DUF1707 SHOCT-like domain-containing protein n=1 Tax=Agromyces sp. Marseille-Q5079 TaxID=3439059 RepID=UPI003D9C7D97